MHGMSQVSDAEIVGSIKSRLGFAGKRTWLKKDNKTVELHDSLTFSTSGIVAFCTLTFFGSSQASCVSARAVNVKVATFKGALHAKHAQIEEEKANAMREIEKTNAMQEVVDEVFLTRTYTPKQHSHTALRLQLWTAHPLTHIDAHAHHHTMTK